MRVLIVDDHEVVRRGVVSLLSSHPNYKVCGEATNGEDAIQKAQSLRPDIVIMDVSMPMLNGLEAARVIHNSVPNCEILVLTQHDATEMARQAFRAGARGYVIKSSVGKNLFAALDKVSRHECYFDPAISEIATPLDVQEILQRSAALEQALRESEQLYRSTFELAAVGVAHVSPSGRWLRVNRKVCDILGYSEAELLQTTFQELTHPDDLAADLSETAKIVSGELLTFSMEKRYIRKDRSIVWVNLTVSGARDSSGKMKHFISLLEDITERRLAEEAQAKLAAIVASSDDAIISKDLNGIITSWNTGATRVFGYTPEETIGKSITILIPRELWDEEPKILERLRRGERIDHFETVRVTKTGKRINVSLSISPVRDGKGRIIGASKIARDITERIRIQNALRDSQAQLALALESSKTAMFDWDIIHGRGTWNEQLAALHEFNPAGEYITAGEWRSLFHPDDLDRLVTDAERAYRDLDTFQFDFRTTPRNGETKWILSHGRVVRDSTGRAIRLIGTHTDITERKRSEQALRNSEERLRAAFGQTYSFLLLLAPDGTIIDANRAALEAAGSEREQLLGHKVWDYWWSSLPDEVEKLKAAVARAGSGQAIREECYFRLPDGTRRFADRTISPVKDSTGSVVMLVASGLDVTEQKALRDQLEDRVKKRTRELQKKNQVLLEQANTVRELSGRLLHAQDEERRRLARELHDSAGQLIAAVQMNLIPFETEADKLGAEFGKAIRESLDFLRQLSEELRTVSHLLHPPLLDEAGLASALRWYVEGFAERSKIDVQLDLAPNLGRLSPDMEVTLFRVVQECLTNIHRHSGSKQATIRVSGSPQEICLEVRDFGKGMPSLKTNGSSAPRSGVGIQGMRERVHQLNGQFEIQSLPDGTQVTARLPLVSSSLLIA
jgi:PAS domain S-box-containing protein